MQPCVVLLVLPINVTLELMKTQWHGSLPTGDRGVVTNWAPLSESYQKRLNFIRVLSVWWPMFKKCESAAGSNVPNKTYLQRCGEQGGQKTLPTALQGARCPTTLTYSAAGSKVALKTRLGTSGDVLARFQQCTSERFFGKHVELPWDSPTGKKINKRDRFTSIWKGWRNSIKKWNILSSGAPDVKHWF